MSLTVLSLFAGIGGIELGLERAGMTTVGQVELDPYCRSVLARHWPEVPRHDDVRTAPAWWLGEARPRVDVICGGFPCQPFSLAGKQFGTADERWGWPWMADVVRAIRPRYVLVENVAALIRDSAAFGWLLGDLASLGFDAEWGVLPACAVGAPHPRERLFLVAHTDGIHGRAGVGTRQELLESGSPRRSSASIVSGAGAGTWRDRVDWAVEAACVDGRDADGLAGRMVEAAGNAVVPAVAEHIGRLIISDAEWRERAA